VAADRGILGSIEVDRPAPETDALFSLRYELACTRLAW
jgi:hypothetical protein